MKAWWSYSGKLCVSKGMNKMHRLTRYLKMYKMLTFYKLNWIRDQRKLRIKVKKWKRII